MLCPRCKQDSSVTYVEDSSQYFCHACSFPFNDATQVIRPVTVDSIWIEVGTGNLVRVLDITGDPFDPATPIRYRSEAEPEIAPSFMLSEDFRHYFRPRKSPKPHRAVTPACQVGEEWESVNGGVYTVLSINRDGDVFMVASQADYLSFWVKGHDFVRMFSKFIRPTDYERLLED